MKKQRRVSLLLTIPAIVFSFALVAASCSSDDGDTTTTTASSDSKSTSEASSAELETWQKDLNAVGCWSGAVDGEMGPQTEAAIKEYQAAAGLTVDGKLGPATESALQKDVEDGTVVCTGSSTTSTTTSGNTTCPGGDDCYETSISPTSGGYGTEITVNITEGGCGDTASLVPPGGGSGIASTGTMDPGAGSLSGTLTVPNEIPAPETYTVVTNEGPQDKCSHSFEVTAAS